MNTSPEPVSLRPLLVLFWVLTTIYFFAGIYTLINRYLFGGAIAHWVFPTMLISGTSALMMMGCLPDKPKEMARGKSINPL